MKALTPLELFSPNPTTFRPQYFIYFTQETEIQRDIMERAVIVYVYQKQHDLLSITGAKFEQYHSEFVLIQQGILCECLFRISIQPFGRDSDILARMDIMEAPGCSGVNASCYVESYKQLWQEMLPLAQTLVRENQIFMDCIKPGWDVIPPRSWNQPKGTF